MPSLYLGKIGGKKTTFEIHALTNGLPFRNYPASSISDSQLYYKLLNGRYKTLEKGRAIYCTAVNPIPDKRIEENPHDSREGTVHIIAVGKDGCIECGLSVAVDLCEKDGGQPIGLPLENVWKRNGFPEGASLDPFRKKYIRSVYHRNNELEFQISDVPFLDGIVDINLTENAIKNGVITSGLVKLSGFDLSDGIRLRAGLGIIGKRTFEEDYHRFNPISKFINKWLLKKAGAGAAVWDFNEIGNLKDFDIHHYDPNL